MLAAIFLALRNKLASPVPRRLLYALFVTTVILYSIFLSSHFQAPRYFIPIILAWEALLIPMSLALFSKVRYARPLVPILLIGFHLAILFVLI